MSDQSMRMPRVTLEDKYTREEGRIFLTGTQALVRLSLWQQRSDAAAGLNTAGFISGYRGSPLGAFDQELWRAQKFLDQHQIRFQPGVNEDLAATAIWGTQQAGLFPGARYDGVFALWYGKGPGVDRSGDVFKHANLAGTAKHGGVLVAFGDDHGAKSSTLAHQSEQALIAAMIPVLNPATIGDILEFGLFGWAMSRYAGVWVGLKCVNELVESTASLDVSSHRRPLLIPHDMPSPAGGVHVRTGHEPIQAEQRLLRHKLPMAVAFVRANGLDKVIYRPDKRRLGIVAAGKVYLDVRQALDRLGIDEPLARELGIGLYKVALTWPLEPQGIMDFAAGFEELLFVEEKRPLMEDQAARFLYDMDVSRRPRIYGKREEGGNVLLPSDGVLDVSMVARVIAGRLERLGLMNDCLRSRDSDVEAGRQASASSPLTIERKPYFCSGCPHNTSTKVPDGSQALAGIGCSYMAVWMDRHTVTSVQMGGEGANWNGIAPFTDTPHIFQNIGDGTYFHSGLMAIRAAVAAGVNITYKILFNDAVAMTGGQMVDGPLSVPRITRQVQAEGVAKIVIVTDEPEKYVHSKDLADGVVVRHRRYLDEVQRDLRATTGVTVLIYDQTCAAEKRRRRKQGKYPDPQKRVFINSAVCEGCGDCSTKANCVSLLPAETEFGRKRQIDQFACNKDYSCLNGFCPSFVTVHGGRLRQPSISPDDDALLHELPEATLPEIATSYGILITGIGGSGVVTIGALLAMAAHVEGKGASVFDMTGLAQKNGAVMSHVRIAARPEDIQAVRIGVGEARLLLGCDLVVAGSEDAVHTLRRDRTRAVVNSLVTPPGDFQLDGDMDFQQHELMQKISASLGGQDVDFIEATRLATALAGDSIATNLFMVGYAWQKGLLPVGRTAIEEAIAINGVAVDANRRAFSWGRLAAHQPDKVRSMLNLPAMEKKTETLEETVERRAAFLTAYQNAAYAATYKDFVDAVARREATLFPGRTALAAQVAKSLFKLMAYKDEYEVARLYANGDFERNLKAQFAGNFRLTFHLAPPLLAPRDPVTGEPRKLDFGPWVFWLFKILAKMKGLRGTWADPFGYTRERRTERALIVNYKAAVLQLLDRLAADTYDRSLELAALPEEIRGFGHVKEKNLAQVRTKWADLVA